MTINRVDTIMMSKSLSRYKSFLLGMAATVAFGVTGSLYADSATYNLDISSPKIGPALIKLGERAGVQILVPHEIGNIENAVAIKGTYTLDQALSQMLAGSGLTYSAEQDGSIRIIEATKNVSDGADSGDNVSFMLEEIVVTAERRAESLLDLPVAISAYSGNNLSEAGVTGVSDLKQLSPSLQFGQTGQDPFVSIRGIGAELVGITSETGVTITQDGVPFSQALMFDPDFFDVERVEVLRGPQGTISGRNATGGAINIHSRKPTEEFEAGLKASIGNYNKMGLSGYASGPLSGDTLLARLAVNVERSDGWLKNTYLDTTENGQDKTQMRASFRANMSEVLTADLVLEASTDRAPQAYNMVLGRARPDVPSAVEAVGVPGFDFDKLEFQGDFPNRRRVKDYKAILNLSWDVNEDTNFSATTSYLIWDQNRSSESDASTTPSFVHFTKQDTQVNQFSQEMTLTVDISEKMDLLIGGLFLGSDLSHLTLLDISAGRLEIPADLQLRSYAIYTQWRYHLTDKLRVGLGTRYTHDKKEHSSGIGFFGAPPGLVNLTGSWEAWTPKVSIDYAANDDLMFYASISKGFKSGGFNSLSSPSRYEPEYIWNYEAGVKADWLDNRVRTSLAGFYMDYTDLQQSLRLEDPPGSGNTFFFIQNAEAATIKGIELEIEALISEQFRVVWAGTWLKARYDSLTTHDPIFPELGERDLAGNQLVRAADFQFSLTAQYTIPLRDEWQAVLRADYQWQDDIFFTFYNHDLNAQKDYGLLNASAAVETEDGRWRLSAFAKNVFDKRYVISSASAAASGVATRSGHVGAPRMYGLSLALKF